LGDDTDTTAAVTDALAGLYYGADAIPIGWLDMLAGLEGIRRIAISMAGAVAA
jgi:ADP-ribosylglycohydrolase